MHHFKIFIELTRLNKPIGFMLLFWPCAWGLAYANSFQNNTDLLIHYLFLFFFGAVLMRSAGCIFNDIVDKDFDIPKDSIASIRSEGLFGKKSLLINPGFDIPFDSSNKNIAFTETTDSYSIDMFLRYLRSINEK